MAEELEMDLVGLSPNADPPVCRIVDFQKFLYEKEEERQGAQGQEQEAGDEEIRFTPHTDEHDFSSRASTPRSSSRRQQGARLCDVQRFRMIVFKSQGEVLLLKFAQRLEEVGVPDRLPKMEGSGCSSP
ncbi:MAG: translation initiation factor IF-3 [Chitinophagales bacterium]